MVTTDKIKSLSSLGAVNTDVQMVHYRTVPLKPIQFINLCHSNKSNPPQKKELSQNTHKSETTLKGGEVNRRTSASEKCGSEKRGSEKPARLTVQSLLCWA